MSHIQKYYVSLIHISRGAQQAAETNSGLFKPSVRKLTDTLWGLEKWSEGCPSRAMSLSHAPSRSCDHTIFATGHPALTQGRQTLLSPQQKVPSALAASWDRRRILGARHLTVTLDYNFLCVRSSDPCSLPSDMLIALFRFCFCFSVFPIALTL